MKKITTAFYLSPFLLTTTVLAETVILDQISIEDQALIDATYAVTQEESLQTRSLSLQDKLERDVSFSVVQDAKGEQALSFRGLDFKNTNYVEDGVPLYRTTTGFVDPNFNMSTMKIYMNDGSGTSSLGVSSTGGEVEIESILPQKEFETTLRTTISNNDELFQAYAGSLQNDFYLQANAGYYHRSDYTLSDDFEATLAQPGTSRVNSDKQHHNFSFKSGFFVNDQLHLAAKVNFLRSKYGLPPNVYTDAVAPVWYAYSRIDQKDLDSYKLYADYTHDNFELTFRAYYDEHADIWAIYDDPSYQSTLPLVDYDDSRLGTIVKANMIHDEHLSSLILQVEENEHIRNGGGLDTAKYIVDTFKASYLHDWEITQNWTMEFGASYSLMKEVEAADDSLINPSQDKDAFDAQVKILYEDKEDTLYLGLAKKSRMPSMDEMFTFFPWETATPDLKPETSMQYTTGYKTVLDKKFSADALVYYYDINDIIIYRDNSFINRENAKHYGVEFRVNSSYFDKNKLALSYAYSHAVDSEDEFLELIPKQQFKLEDTITINQDYKAYIAYQFIDSRYSSNTATYTDEQKKLSEYHLLETQLAYQLTSSIDTRIGIKNILDENYEWRYGYPAQGRSYYFSLEWKM